MKLFSLITRTDLPRLSAHHSNSMGMCSDDCSIRLEQPIHIWSLHSPNRYPITLGSVALADRFASPIVRTTIRATVSFVGVDDEGIDAGVPHTPRCILLGVSLTGLRVLASPAVMWQVR